MVTIKKNLMEDTEMRVTLKLIFSLHHISLYSTFVTIKYESWLGA